MKNPIRTLMMIFFFVALVGGTFVMVRFYSFVFAKTIVGEIQRVERVTNPEMIIGNTAAIPANQIFSYAVAIRDSRGEIHTASTEDRQWAVAQKGQCVEAKYFPYPPWQLDKAGTYHSARLLRLYECDGQRDAQRDGVKE